MSERKVPKLRFPEYNQSTSHSYSKYIFSDIFTFAVGKNIKQNESSSEFDTPCVRYGELYHMYNEVIKAVINKTNLCKSELIFSEGDEILLPSAGEDPLDISSASALTVRNVAIGRTINILKPLKSNVYSQIYVAYYINHRLKNKIATLAKGVSISNVYNSDLKTLEITLPSFEEQTKIADFLTSIDDRIQQLTKKKELLEQYKKGVMQQIFSQKIRFKDDNGNDYPDWEEKILGDIATTKVTNSFSRENLNYENGEVRNIHYGDIHTKFPALFDVEKENVPFINPEIKLDKISADNYCIEGDLVFADASEDLNDVGKSIEIINLDNKKLISGLHTILVRPQKNIFQKGFAGHLFKFNQVRLQIQKESQGSKVLSISGSRLLKVKFYLPCLEEQTKIADFLTSIDDKITQVSTQLEQTKLFKKSLLQQMFI